jgi:hypothetical protein
MPLTEKQKLDTAMLMVKQANPMLARALPWIYQNLLKRPVGWGLGKLWKGFKGIPGVAKSTSLFAAPMVPYMAADATPVTKYLPGVGSGFDDAVFRASSGRITKDHRQLMEGMQRFVSGNNNVQQVDALNSIV